MANPLITNMNINSQRYDLAGGGGSTIYHEGEGIIIGPDGSINWDGNLGWLTSEQWNALVEELAQTNIMITAYGAQSSEFGRRIESSASIITRLNSEMGFVQAEILANANRIDSEGHRLDALVRIMPEKIETAVTGVLTDSEFSTKIAASVLRQTQRDFEMKFEELDEATGLLSQVGDSINFSGDGIKLSPGRDSRTYTKISSDGMEIWANGTKVAEATSNRFTCVNGFGIDGWVIAKKGTNGNNLVFYKEV